MAQQLTTQRHTMTTAGNGKEAKKMTKMTYEELTKLVDRLEARIAELETLLSSDEDNDDDDDKATIAHSVIEMPCPWGDGGHVVRKLSANERKRIIRRAHLTEEFGQRGADLLMAMPNVFDDSAVKANEEEAPELYRKRWAKENASLLNPGFNAGGARPAAQSEGKRLDMPDGED